MKAIPLEALPLFADDAQLGAALLGRARVAEWREIAPLLERRGLPKIDELMGGRYVPAVRAYFDGLYGLRGSAEAPRSPDGIEDLGKWKETAKAARRHRV